MTTNTLTKGIVELYNEMSYEETQDVFPIAKKWLCGKDPLKCFHQGKLELISESGKCNTRAVKDPCTDNYIFSLVVPSAEDIKTVLLSLSHGQTSWNSLDQHSRGILISRVAKKLEEQKDVLAEVEALTIGASLPETKRDVARSYMYFNYYASWAHLIKKKIEDPEDGALVICLTKPAPVSVLASVVASALASGHAVLINPLIESSLSSFLLAELCSSAGLPPGVVNVVPGTLKPAKELIEEKANKIVMWGSGPTCRHLCSDLANLSRPVVPFYYGKTISIIFDSSDQSSALDVLLKNISFSYQQMPWSVRTILVEESAYSTFVDMLKKKLGLCKVGNFRESGVDIGLPKKCDGNTSTYLNDVLKHFVQRGIEVFQIPVADSLFFPPTLLVGTDGETNSIVKDYEILPFVSILPFRRPNEAIEIANKNHFGVAASVWTTCLSLALYMASNLEVGTVWINDHGLIDSSVTFSNRKHGFGCIGGQRGLLQFLSFPLREGSNLSEENKQVHIKSPVQKEYLPHYGGSFKQTTNENHISVFSSSGSHFTVRECDRNDVKKAVEAAGTAQQKWWKLSSNERAALLINASDKFQETSNTFLKLFIKTAPESERELENVVNNLYIWASRCNNMISSKNSTPAPNTLVQDLHHPLGVIGILIDDSSEFDTFALAAASAISFGNSVVVVPNSKNPILALEFCSFLTNLKVPPGLVNIIPGSKCNLYSEVVSHKDVQAVWYSGNDKKILKSLHNMTNKVMKLLWKFPDNSVDYDASKFEYAASHKKSVWLQSENTSC